MQIKEKEKDGVVILALNGELTIDSLDTLKEIFKKTISRQARKVLLDCKKLEYVDSVGFSCLIQFSKDLKGIEGSLFFSNLTPKVRSLFAITKLDSVFKIFEEQNEALREFSGY